MSQTLSLVTLVVDDYDHAIAHYRDALGFEVREDTDLGGGKRWVRVAPAGDGGTGLLLAVASTAEQRARIGDQTGGRVAFSFRRTTSGATMRAWSPPGSNSWRRRARKATPPSSCSAMPTAIAGTCCNPRADPP